MSERLRAFRLLVFDWDGTLMDSEARIVACMQDAMADLGLTPLEASRIRNIIGLGLGEALEVLFPGRERAFRERVADRYRHHFLGTNGTPSRLFPGVIEVLGALREDGYLLAIATGKSRRGLDRALAETGLRALFDATRCADEAFSKPHPQMLLDLMDRLGARPDETLMIGDTEYDLLMASGAGVPGVAACYGVHDPGRLKALQPLACLQGISELLPWLRKGCGA